VHTINAPAKGPARGEIPPSVLRRREEGAGNILRLRGGAGVGESDNDSDQSQLSVQDGRVLVGGTPLQGVSIAPVVRLERANPGPSQSAEGREKARERALFEQRSARRAELKNKRGIQTDSEDSSDAVVVERARFLDRGRNTRPERRGGPSHSEGEEEDEVTVTAVPAKRGPGHPPTTAEYVGLAAAKEELNRQLARESELLYEIKIAKMTSKEVLQILIKAEEVTVEAEYSPTADIINRIREHQVDVVRAVKTSNNLKGTH